jgi:hypothetical protein
MRVPFNEIETALGHHVLKRTSRVYAKYDPDYLLNVSKALSIIWTDYCAAAQEWLAVHLLSTPKRGHRFDGAKKDRYAEGNGWWAVTGSNRRPSRCKRTEPAIRLAGTRGIETIGTRTNGKQNAICWPFAVHGESMIYFIQSGRSEFVKIGHCSGEPSIRLGQLQVGNPERLRLIAVKEGGKEVETRWHAMFEHLHVRGEWFRWDDELRDAAKPLLVDADEIKAARITYARDLVAGRQSAPETYEKLFSDGSWSPARRAAQKAKATEAA